jgi:hypothetical protein
MGPRTYTEAEIRLCRIFVVVLFAISAFSGLAGILNLHRWPSAPDSVSPKGVEEVPGKTGKGGRKGSSVNVPLAYLLTSAAFLALSVAAGLGVRRVTRNRLHDVELDPVSAARQQEPTGEAAAGTRAAPNGAERSCPGCGARVAATARFCPFCSAFVPAALAAATEQSEKLSTGTVLVALLGLAFGFFSGMTWAHLCYSGLKWLEAAAPFIGAAVCAYAGTRRRSVGSGALVVLATAVGFYLVGDLYNHVVHMQ